MLQSFLISEIFASSFFVVIAGTNLKTLFLTATKQMCHYWYIHLHNGRHSLVENSMPHNIHFGLNSPSSIG
jgi:hypothetical protein